jgi:hypothetical protein
MPPQQPDGPLDVFNQGFDFRTHETAPFDRRSNGRRMYLLHPNDATDFLRLDHEIS